MDTSQLVTDAILAVLTAVAGVVARAYMNWAAQHESVETQTFIGQVAGIAVHAAQQLFDTKVIGDRKAYAIGLVDGWLNEAGIHLTADQISAAIEATVHSELKMPGGVVLEVGETETVPPDAPLPPARFADAPKSTNVKR
jgi:hypothetical protein